METYGNIAILRCFVFFCAYRLCFLLYCRKGARLKHYSLSKWICHILGTGSQFVFTPVSNPLTLHCDHFDCSSEQNYHEPVDLATIDCDITLWQRILQLKQSLYNVNQTWTTVWQLAPLPHKVKRQYLQIKNIVDTSI